MSIVKLPKVKYPFKTPLPKRENYPRGREGDKPYRDARNKWMADSDYHESEQGQKDAEADAVSKEKAAKDRKDAEKRTKKHGDEGKSLLGGSSRGSSSGSSSGGSRRR